MRNQVIAVPDELSKYYRYLTGEASENDFEIETSTTIYSDSRGRVVSVDFCSEDGELVKKIFYEGNLISKINTYHMDLLYSTEIYNKDRKVEKTIFKKNGDISTVYKFEYNNKNRICRILKTTSKYKIMSAYKYDNLDRIIERNIYKDDKLLVKQEYKYDILDRIIEYKDNEMRIAVKNISNKNELLSYIITDRMGNDIAIENHFSDCDYICTQMLVNGHSATLNDTSYVDNKMLKKPYASDEDLDFIISNLFKTDKKVSYEKNEETDLKKSLNFIDNNIQSKALPISIRKRVLYNIKMGTK